MYHPIYPAYLKMHIFGFGVIFLQQRIEKDNIILKNSKSGSSRMGQDHSARSPWTGCSQFLPTTQKIIQFSDGKPPKSTDKIVSNVDW